MMSEIDENIQSWKVLALYWYIDTNLVAFIVQLQNVLNVRAFVRIVKGKNANLAKSYELIVILNIIWSYMSLNVLTETGCH